MTDLDQFPLASLGLVAGLGQVAGLVLLLVAGPVIWPLWLSWSGPRSWSRPAPVGWSRSSSFDWFRSGPCDWSSSFPCGWSRSGSCLVWSLWLVSVCSWWLLLVNLQLSGLSSSSDLSRFMVSPAFLPLSSLLSQALLSLQLYGLFSSMVSAPLWSLQRPDLSRFLVSPALWSLLLSGFFLVWLSSTVDISCIFFSLASNPGFYAQPLLLCYLQLSCLFSFMASSALWSLLLSGISSALISPNFWLLWPLLRSCFFSSLISQTLWFLRSLKEVGRVISWLKAFKHTLPQPSCLAAIALVGHLGLDRCFGALGPLQHC